MAPTTIKYIRNSTNIMISVFNQENPSDTNGDDGIVIHPGKAAQCSMWIPGAGNYGELNDNKRIDFRTYFGQGTPMKNASMWEHEHYIRYLRSSAQGYSPSDGDFVEGNPAEGGDRTLEIQGTYEDWKNVKFKLY